MEPVSLSTTLLVGRLEKLEVRIEDLLEDRKRIDDLLEDSIALDDVEQLQSFKSSISLQCTLLDTLSKTEVGQDGPVKTLLAKVEQFIIEAYSALQKSSEPSMRQSLRMRIITRQR